MKAKILISIVSLFFVSEVYSQFKVNADGSAQFKVNNISAGFTGINAQGNVSFGYGSLLNLSAGTYNTAIGSSALNANATTGNYNTGIGSNALNANTSGSSNTATGVCALYVNTTGGYNTAYGHQALINNTTGSYNTAIGYQAGSNNPVNATNSTAIGYAAAATASNQVRIGNSSVSSIGGYANWSNISDGRAKKNIRADVPGLDFIGLLQPVTYNLDLDAMDNLLGIDKAKLEKDMPQNLKAQNEKAKKAKQEQVQTGFVAQDVEKTAKSIGYNFSGVNVDESGIYSLSYAEFVVPLVKAVQELKAQNDLLQKQINELKGNKATLRSATDETGTTGIVSPVTAQCKLSQNAPNPFTNQTEINYFVATEVKNAYICIFDMQGKMLQKIDASTGQNSVMIQGSTLQAGIYLYALVADGQEVDTKRMILTK
ncbi:hypothetical protein FACS1894160_1780 [Bacteroidia bacterium]|nr:hypothetical protein FACS1894160_1780 [Bacteroidia bacterium]